MSDPTEVLSLYEPEGLHLGIDDQGRGFYGSAPTEQQGGSIPAASFSGRSQIATAQPKGIGGSVQPGFKERAVPPEELMRLADQLESSFQFNAGPSAVEPTLERDTSVPFWLRKYAAEEGLSK